MTPKRGNKCPYREAEGSGQFWCDKFNDWFKTNGFECSRCQAGKPVKLEAYRASLDAAHPANTVNTVNHVRRGANP